MIVSGLYFNQPMILTIERNDSRHLHNGRHDEKGDLHYINFRISVTSSNYIIEEKNSNGYFKHQITSYLIIKMLVKSIEILLFLYSGLFRDLLFFCIIISCLYLYYIYLKPSVRKYHTYSRSKKSKKHRVYTNRKKEAKEAENKLVS